MGNVGNGKIGYRFEGVVVMLKVAGRTSTCSVLDCDSGCFGLEWFASEVGTGLGFRSIETAAINRRESGAQQGQAQGIETSVISHCAVMRKAVECSRLE